MNSNQSDTKLHQQHLIEVFWETIPSTWNHVRQHIRSTASEKFDITVEQFYVLRHVKKGVKTVSELAEVKHISRSAVSQAVDGLVCKNLLTRRQDEEDRRYIWLEMTEEGEGLLNKIFKINQEWILKKIENLSSDDIKMIITGLQTLKRVLNE